MVKQGKAIPQHTYGGQGERMYSSYSFTTSTLHGLSRERHAPSALYPWERTPITHWTGVWMGPRAGLSTEASAGDRTSIAGSSNLQSDTTLTEPPRLPFRIYEIRIILSGNKRYFINSMNYLTFITQKCCVISQVRTKFLNNIWTTSASRQLTMFPFSAFFP
jgi:hypothetical protein